MSETNLKVAFVSHVRTGLAAAAHDEASDGRAAVTISLGLGAVPATVGADPASRSVSVTLPLMGPGDVAAIEPRQIVRRHPTPDASGVAPNDLAHIEFDRPEMPWLFSPGRPDAERHLLPWLALVVVDEERFAPAPPVPGQPPRIETVLGELQDLEDGWAWAHAQVLLDGGGAALTIEALLTDQHALANLSRLVCPRRLRPNRSYRACLVPAFAVGIAAAMDASSSGGPAPSATVLAWKRAPGDGEVPITLPVFDSWRFSTGDEGDFEALAQRLRPIEAGAPLGRRSIDVSRPWGHGEPVAPGAVQPVEGPLVAPVATGPHVPPASVWPAPVTATLRARLNGPAALAGSTPSAAVPRVGPPIYAGSQTARRQVPEQGGPAWFSSLNLHPAHRMAASAAARVVQHDQEALMQAAWSQLGEVEQVNAELRRAQLARFVLDALYRRHLEPLGFGHLLQIARPVQGQILGADRVTTIRDALAGSATASAASTTAFRRVVGPVAAGPLLAAQDDTPRDFRRRYDDSWRTRTNPDASTALELVFVEPKTFEERVAQRNLDVVLAALPAEPAADPMRASALLPSLAILARAAGTTGTQAKDELFNVGLGTGAIKGSHVAAKVRERFTPQQGKAAALESIRAAEPAPEAVALALVVVPDTALSQAFTESTAAMAAAAAEQLTAEIQAAATTLVTATLVAVPTGQPLEQPDETTIDPLVERDDRIDLAFDPTALPPPAGLEPVDLDLPDLDLPDLDLPDLDLPDLEDEVPDIDVDVEIPGVEIPGTDLPGTEIPGTEVPDIALPDLLETFEIPQSELEQLALGAEPDTVLSTDELAKIALDRFEPADFPDLAREFLGPDAQAELARHLEDDVLQGVVDRCWEDEGGPVIDDPRIAELFLVWMARREYPPQDVPDLCPESFAEFLANALHVHQVLPPILVSDEAARRLKRLLDELRSSTWPLTPPLSLPAVRARDLRDGLDPKVTVTRRAAERLGPLPDWVPAGWLETTHLRPLVVTPVFTRPMVEALEGCEPDWIVPGLDAVPQRDLVTALESNPVFVEAFLAGLSHEMARELLWRGYPTDQRGTHFRRFWSRAQDELRADLHQLDDGALGSHVIGSAAGMLVVVVRGELIRRYPDVLASAVRADRVVGGIPAFSASGETAPVVFSMLRSRDVLLVGLALTHEQVRAARSNRPWWFLLAEHPTAPRFGVDVGSPADPTSGFLGASGFGGSAAEVADTLIQRPVRAAFDLGGIVGT